jgi:ABC-2 type transport system ATP-binding protein
MIEIHSLSKAYSTTWALQGVTFRVEAGDMFGLIGPNGAGKTTLIRILATLLRPTSGIARIDGRPVTTEGRFVRARIGYLPDTFGVYEDMRVEEYLEFFAAAYRVPRDRRRETIDGVLELTDLAAKRRAIVGTLSRGMQQRLGLARVLVHDPKVLLLDEPASGLDPRARIELRALLKELRRMGKTILISSHILADLADLCNKIGLIERGRLIYAGDLREAMARVQEEGAWIVQVAADTERAGEILSKQPFVARVEGVDGQLRVILQAGFSDVHAIPQVLVQNGLQLKLFKQADVTLEDAFLRLTKGEVS